MNKFVLLALVLASPAALAVSLQDVLTDEYGVWSIPADGKIKRWIVIHNLDDARQSQLFHIEILGLKKGQEPWQVMRLQNHMAITADALIKNLIAPKPKGKVYPEAFDNAYDKWLISSPQNICQTSILDCLQKP